jgi:hypothetical protein
VPFHVFFHSVKPYLFDDFLQSLNPPFMFGFAYASVFGVSGKHG